MNDVTDRVVDRVEAVPRLDVGALAGPAYRTAQVLQTAGQLRVPIGDRSYSKFYVAFRYLEAATNAPLCPCGLRTRKASEENGLRAG